MKTILLETNAISRCLDHSITGKDLLTSLNKKNFTPVINLHTKYELARTFLNPEKLDRGKSLFIILRELNPCFSCPTDELIKRELKKLQNGNSVDWFCDPATQEQAYMDITNLSEGRFAPEIKEFILKRESDLQEFLSTYNRLKTEENKEALKDKSYEEFVKHYTDPKNIQQPKTHLFNIIGKSLTEAEITRFLNAITSYPALNTHLRIDLYLNHTVIKSGNKPAKDKTDDFRHLIDASYCSSLVTNDQKLTTIAHQICPEIEIITLEDLIAS